MIIPSNLFVLSSKKNKRRLEEILELCEIIVPQLAELPKTALKLWFTSLSTKGPCGVWGRGRLPARQVRTVSLNRTCRWQDSGLWIKGATGEDCGRTHKTPQGFIC